jgi:hypothetical protein
MIMVSMVVAALALILAGIGLIIFREPPQPPSPHPVVLSREGFKIRTTSTGLVLIGIGAFLLIVAAGTHAFSN